MATTRGDEIISLIRARSAALLAGDVSFLEQFLADDFTYTNASGAVLTKTMYLQFYIESDAITWQAQELDDVQIRHYGDVAVLTCRIYDALSVSSRPYEL